MLSRSKRTNLVMPVDAIVVVVGVGDCSAFRCVKTKVFGGTDGGCLRSACEGMEQNGGLNMNNPSRAGRKKSA